MPNTFLALNPTSPPTWRLTQPWHQYNTATEDSREYNDAESFAYKPSTSERPTDPAHQAQESRGTQRDNGDALDFILDGYETKPSPRPPPVVGRKRPGSNFSIYDSYVANRGSKARENRRADPHVANRGFEGRENRRALIQWREVTPRSRRTSNRSLPQRIKNPAEDFVSKSTRLENDLRKRYHPALWARPKWVSVASLGQADGQALSRIWNFNYARAQNVYEQLQKGASRKKKAPAPILHPHTAKWVETTQERVAANKEIDFKELAANQRQPAATMWAHVVLWMLHYDKDGLVEFLLATPSSVSPGPWVADCLQVLAAHYRLLPKDDAAQWIEKLRRIFCALSENIERQGIAFDGRFVHMVLPYCTPLQVSELYKAIRLGEFKIHWNTLMHLTRYFATHDHFDQALDVLLEAHRGGARISSFQFKSNCATLLRKSIEQPGGLRVCLRIVDNLVKIGVRLNTQLCNIIILNAVETGDVNTANAIYHSLVEHNVKANKYTYAILLKGCKVNIDDADALNHTITSAIEKFDISENPIIAAEILHCLALHHVRNSGSNAWSIIGQAYAQMYELEALTQLGLPVPNAVRKTPRAKEPAPPSPQAIGIMLRTWLQLNIDSPDFNARVKIVYSRFRDLVWDGMKPFAQNAMTTHCHNAFLGAFTGHKRSLTDAAGVIKDMQHSSALPRPRSCAPDVQSWSIFLHGFTRHGQLKLAEQVLDYMRDKGVEPNSVTWNQLMTGYAGEQDAEGLRDVMARAEESGHVWDEWTYGGLRRFRNSAKMQALIESRNKEVPLDFTSDLKEGIEARMTQPEAEEKLRSDEQPGFD